MIANNQITNKKKMTLYRKIQYFLFCIIIILGISVELIYTNKVKDDNDIVSLNKLDKCFINKPRKFLYFSQFYYSKTNEFSYKNFLALKNNLVVFDSKNQFDSALDDSLNSANYINSYKINKIFTPCINKSMLCSHKQFMKEYQNAFPNIDFGIPKIIKDYFNNINKASENCVLLIENSFLNLSEVIWVCHDNFTTILSFQLELSNNVELDQTNQEYFAHYIYNKSSKVPGVLQLNENKILFINKNRKKLVDIDYTNVEPYAFTLYLKEKLPWTGLIVDSPEDSRCFKIKEVTGGSHYFCLFYGRYDLATRKIISVLEAQWLSEMYITKINNKVQNILVKKNIQEIYKLNTPFTGLDDKLMLPIRNQVRKDFLVGKFEIINLVKSGIMLKKDYDNELKSLKNRVIKKDCNNIFICIKAIEFYIENDLLSLTQKNSKIAMDQENPFNSLMPKTYLKIPFPNAGIIGKELIEKLVALKPGKIKNVYTQVQNNTYLSKKKLLQAFNTFTFLRSSQSNNNSIEYLKSRCLISQRINASHLKRKVALLMWMGNSDPFLANLESMKNKLFN